MTQSVLCPRRLPSALRAKAALELRLEGLTFEQIAERLNLASRSNARRCVQRGLKEISLSAAMALLKAEGKNEAAA